MAWLQWRWVCKQWLEKSVQEHMLTCTHTETWTFRAWMSLRKAIKSPKNPIGWWRITGFALCNLGVVDKLLKFNTRAWQTNSKDWLEPCQNSKIANAWRRPAQTAGLLASHCLTPYLFLSLAEQGVGPQAGGAQPQGHDPEQGGIRGEESSCRGCTDGTEQRFLQQEPPNVSRLLS